MQGAVFSDFQKKLTENQFEGGNQNYSKPRVESGIQSQIKGDMGNLLLFKT